jgi:hypothetical protein
MKFRLYREFGALNSVPIFDAVEKGLRRLGHKIVTSNEDIPVIWSILFHGRMSGNKRIWDTAKSLGKPVMVLEVGGIKRNVTWKVGLNGINRDAFFGNNSNSDSTRAESLGLSLKPWTNSGENILICGQHDRSLQWHDMPKVSNWLIRTIDELRKHTSRPIIFRPHPRCRLPHIEHEFRNVKRQEPNQISGTYDEFDISFRNVWATINYSSNPGIHSVIQGVPAFVGQSSLAYDVANDIDFLHEIENPLKPDRQQWLNEYAYTEWTEEEIKKGSPLERILLDF